MLFAVLKEKCLPVEDMLPLKGKEEFLHSPKKKKILLFKLVVLHIFEAEQIYSVIKTCVLNDALFSSARKHLQMLGVTDPNPYF